MFLSRVLLLRSFFGVLRIIPLRYGNIIAVFMVALQVAKSNEELCLNVVFLHTRAAG